MSTLWDIDNLEDRHTLYHGENCMKKFCTSLIEHAVNVTSFEKKKMLQIKKSY